jgi:hypothetical protein
MDGNGILATEQMVVTSVGFVGWRLEGSEGVLALGVAALTLPARAREP